MSVSFPKRILLTLILLLSFFLSSCGAFSLDDIFPNMNPDPSTEVMVEVTFFVQVPLNTPEGEIIYLSTLDEVTGLGVNATAHPMEPALGDTNLDQGLIYQTTLSVPQHAILKYRYTRQNQYAVIEHTQVDEQVRYRMAKADNPLEIRDVVSKWSDTSYYWPEPGRISGIISDSQTGEPVPGMLVIGGGVQAFTTASGTYMLPGLPPGIHNLVVYAPDGSYQEIQQGAEVASQANTEANLSITPREYVDVTFLVTVPIGTPENSVRLVGNLYQLGNTFGNLPGGMNTIPSRMLHLTSAGDNRYGIIVSLPVGAEIRYKYTLGDGFWNAEHSEDGSFFMRRFIVPSQPIQYSDEVVTWKSGPKDSITFDLWTPENTPVGEKVYIQFNPYGWTTPLPMTEIAPNHWVFILFSPFDILSDLSYRYCREGECGIADDAATAGTSSSGRQVSPSAEPQYIADTIADWAWLEAAPFPVSSPLPAITSRGEGFLTGIEFMPGSKAADSIQMSTAIPDIAGLNSKWIILTPTWSFTHQNPPVIEPDPNHDPLWSDLSSMTGMAYSEELKVALNPQPQFPVDPAEWWMTAPLDFSWWNSWFDQYHAFAIHFAETAEIQGADMLILGGDWLIPALPGGKLADGDPSGVPADSGLRWIEIMNDVDARFSGMIAWSMSLPVGGTMPDYFEHVDQVQLNWNPKFEITAETTLEELVNTANLSLDDEVQSFWSNWLKKDDKLLVLRVQYPSAAGWNPVCPSDSSDPCYPPSIFSSPAPIVSELGTGFSEQALAYQAYLSTGPQRSWVSGMISLGYYAPAVLHDKSISIHGKPAEYLVQQWFLGLR
jgi:hypothetical protein